MQESFIQQNYCGALAYTWNTTITCMLHNIAPLSHSLYNNIEQVI